MLRVFLQRRSGQRVVVGAVVTPGGAARPSGAGTHAPVAQGPGQGLDSQRWISTVSTCLLQAMSFLVFFFFFDPALPSYPKLDQRFFLLFFPSSHGEIHLNLLQGPALLPPGGAGGQ